MSLLTLTSSLIRNKLARAAGFEPATKWLTATYSTAEPCPNKKTASSKDRKEKSKLDAMHGHVKEEKSARTVL